MLLTELNLPVEEHQILAQRIEELISGQQVLFHYSETVERLGQIYASQLIRRLSEVVIEEETQTPQADFVTIDVNSIEKSEPRSVGTEHLLLKMAHQLQLPKKLKELDLW